MKGGSITQLLQIEWGYTVFTCFPQFPKSADINQSSPILCESSSSAENEDAGNYEKTRAPIFETSFACHFIIQVSLSPYWWSLYVSYAFLGQLKLFIFHFHPQCRDLVSDCVLILFMFLLFQTMVILLRASHLTLPPGVRDL